jgi:hypothetical protein
MKIFTTYNSAEEYFYRECIASQREYCKAMNYEYIELVDIDVNETSTWKPFRILEALILQNSEKVIAFMKPSVMIMNMHLDLKQFTPPPGSMLMTNHGGKMIDSVLIMNCTKKLAQHIDFALKFKDEPTSGDFAYQLLSIVGKEIANFIAPRILSSRWYTHDISTVKLNVDTAVDFPVVVGDLTEIDHMSSKDCIFDVGDFSVDFGENKHEAKMLATQFDILRVRIEDKYQEANKIIEDAKRYAK